MEAFNARLRDELLDGEILDRLAEAKVVVEADGGTSTRCAPHGALGYNPPGLEIFVPAMATRGLRKPDLLCRPCSRRGHPSTKIP